MRGKNGISIKKKIKMHTKVILENQALIMRALSHFRNIPDDITKELIEKSNSTKLLSKITE